MNSGNEFSSRLAAQRRVDMGRVLIDLAHTTVLNLGIVSWEDQGALGGITFSDAFNNRRSNAPKR